MRQGDIITVPSTGTAVTLAQAKHQLRIEQEDDSLDPFIQSLCAQAHAHLERDLRFPILRQTRETHFMGWPIGQDYDHNRLRFGSGDNLTVESVRYFDSAGVSQTLSLGTGYLVDAVSRVAALMPPHGSVWPITQCQPGAVIVEWSAGWTTPELVPADLTGAMKLLIGHWEQNREAVVNGTISTEVKLSYDLLIQNFRPMMWG